MLSTFSLQRLHSPQVEGSLLLHDALHAQAPVWGEQAGRRGDTCDTWSAPQPSSGLLQVGIVCVCSCVNLFFMGGFAV
jgi:hypothetical protein